MVRRAREGRHSRRGARVVDRDGLENRCACKCTVGSNPTLSATNLLIRLDFCDGVVGAPGGRQDTILASWHAGLAPKILSLVHLRFNRLGPSRNLRRRCAAGQVRRADRVPLPIVICRAPSRSIEDSRVDFVEQSRLTKVIASRVIGFGQVVGATTSRIASTRVVSRCVPREPSTAWNELPSLYARPEAWSRTTR